MINLLINNAFPQFEQDLRDELAKKGTLKEFKKGEIILKMGQPFKNAYFILKGCVKVYRENAEDAEFVVAYLEEGKSFAVSASEDSTDITKASLVTFYALEKTYILNLPFNDKDVLAKKFDSFYKYILATSVMYYSFFLDIIDYLAFKKLDIRLEFFLFSLSRITKKKELDISHQEIANGLSASRESVSRLLKKMETDGKIKMKHNEIEIISL
jgi:CRP/FNR family transcriptional regulator, anaerobic regulatory protein